MEAGIRIKFAIKARKAQNSSLKAGKRSEACRGLEHVFGKLQ